GPRQDLTGKINNNRWYYAEAWMKMATTPEEPTISLVLRKGGNPDLVIRPTKTASAPAQTVGVTWTKVTFAIYATWSSTYDNTYWRAETNTSNQNFCIDDVKLIEG